MPRLFKNLFRSGGKSPQLPLWSSGLFNVWGRNPNYPVFRRRGPIGRIFDLIPAPLKAFAVISGLAAVTVIVTPALLIIAGPPLICGAWWLNRQRIAMNALAKQMHDRRWVDMASYHLQSSSDAWGGEKIPTSARLVIEDAVKSDQQGIAQKLGARGTETIEYGPVLSLHQDFRATNGSMEEMTMGEYPVYVDGSQRGKVRIVNRTNDDTKGKKMRIEFLINDGSILVLKSDGSQGNVIEGHGTRIK